jgi:hypothetical protein
VAFATAFPEFDARLAGLAAYVRRTSANTFDAAALSKLLWWDANAVFRVRARLGLLLSPKPPFAGSELPLAAALKARGTARRGRL